MLRIFYLIVFTTSFSTHVFAQQACSIINDLTFPDKCRLYDSLRHAHSKGENLIFTKQLQPYIDCAIKNDDVEFELLLGINLLHKAYQSGEINDTQFVVKIEKYIVKCKQDKINNLLPIAYNAYSNYWQGNNNGTQRIRYALMAYDIYSTYSAEYFIYKKVYLRHLTKLYLNLKEYKSAKRILHQALQITAKEDNDILNTLAIAHMRTANIDSAHYYYNRLYTNAILNNQKNWQVIARSNIVDLFLFQKKYDTALSICKKVLPLAKKYTGKYIQGDIYYRMATIASRKGNITSANRYYLETIELYRTKGKFWYYKLPGLSYPLYRRFAQIKNKLGDNATAFRYSDTANMITDSMQKSLTIVQLKNIEKELVKANYDRANRELYHEKEQAKQQRNLFIVGIIATIFILLYLVARYRNKKQKLEKEHEKASYLLQIAQDKLTSFTQRIQEKNKLLENLEQKVEDYENNEEKNIHYKTLNNLQEATILTDSEWDDFRKTFETVHVGFLSRLKNSHPQLTPAEVRYFVLVKLNMSTKEMASVLGVNASSIRTIKSRIIKKLAISNEQELVDVINNI